MRFFSINLILIFCLFSNVLGRYRTYEDQVAIYKMIRTIGPSYVCRKDDNIYFIRPNEKIPLDSVPIIIIDLFKDKVKSIKSYYDNYDKRIFMDCNKDTIDQPIIGFSLGLTVGHFTKAYSLYIYVDTVDEIIGICSYRWAYVFVEPVYGDNKYSKKAIKLFTEKYNNSEYIGCSKLKCRITMPIKYHHKPEKQFWYWFKKNEYFLFQYENNKNRIDSYFYRKLLRPLDGEVMYKIGPESNNNRELILYCVGYRRERLLKALPKLRFWKVTFKNYSEK